MISSAWKYLRIGLGVALGVYAIFLFLISLPKIFVIGPFLLAVAGSWLVIGPRKILERNRDAKLRYKQYLESAPRDKKLERWSRWINWAAVPICGVWFCFWISHLPRLNIYWAMAIGAIPFVIGLVLSNVVIYNWYSSRKRQKSGQ